MDKSITLTIDRRPTNITVVDISTVYGVDEYLIITFRDFQGYNLTGKTISVDLNGVKEYTTDENGQIMVPTKGVPAGNYIAAITFNGTYDNYNTSTAAVNVTIEKAAVLFVANPVSTVYNGNKYLVATLMDGQGNLITGVTVSTSLNSFKPQSTDKNGQVKWSANGLAPINTNVVLTYAGNNNYLEATQTVAVKVVKATPKIVAKAKTFKRSDKYKKYTVTFTNQNKGIAKVRVYITVGKKTYYTTTSSKGVALFKLTKLTKKGKYTAKVMFKANSYYNAKTLNVKIVVK